MGGLGRWGGRERWVSGGHSLELHAPRLVDSYTVDSYTVESSYTLDSYTVDSYTVDSYTVESSYTCTSAYNSIQRSFILEC